MPVAPLFRVERPPDEGGQDALVVAVHGTMDRSAGFAGVRRELTDLRTLVYDRRGYGRSRDTGPALDLDAGVDDLLDLCGSRQVAVVVGHSYGGCIALRAAQRAPGVVRSVAVYEPPLPWLVGWPADTGSSRALSATDPEAAAEAYMRRVIGDRRWEELPERVRARRRSEAPALLADLRSVRPRPGAAPPIDLEAVAVPVVVGRGTRSPPHLLAGAERLVGLLPHAEPAVVAGAGHGAHTTHPEAVAAMVRQALRLALAEKPGWRQFPR